MLSLEEAALAVFGTPSSERGDEAGRLSALASACHAMEAIENLGLRCAVFGSALRPGDFFHHSDVDLAAWMPDLSPVGAGAALAARLACHDALRLCSFDLVLLPCSNVAFGDRILNQWGRERAEVARASRGEPMERPLSFGPSDVAFIDSDRLEIASRAARRMAVTASEDLGPRGTLSLCASMQTIVRVADKCAKDILREFANARPGRGEASPLYPILAYPCQALGGQPLAGDSSLALYFECCSMLEPPEEDSSEASAAWRDRMALLGGLFAASMTIDFGPALRVMATLGPRERPAFAH